MELPSIDQLRENSWSSYWYKRRRHTEWTDNYTLYRDKVQMNRLTQRQSVNIPLIKYSIKTLLKDIDDAPMLYFTNLDNDEQAEVFYNEYWHQSSIYTKTILKDIVDKRQVLLFGRTFKHLNLVNGRFYWEVKDPQDIDIDRYVDPADLDTARFLIIKHNYVPLSSLGVNPRWNKIAVAKLQQYFSSDEGLHHAQANMLDFVEKQARMLSMGVVDQMNPILGETYIELIEHFTKVFDKTLGKDRIIYSVVADDREALFQAPLDEVIGKTQDDFWQDHFPLTSWADETERTDFWSDGVADTLRTLNKIMNAWFSQMVENRTLRNFGMNFFNASLTDDGFRPQTYTPEPFGWYPIPAGEKALGDQMMHVDIPDISTESMKEMEFIQNIAQQASAATDFQQGVSTPQEMTLGEVKLVLQNAQQRVQAMAVYYNDSWKDFGLKYIKLLEAAPHLIDPMTIHKKGRLTKKMYSAHITPEKWMTKTGFICEAKVKSEAQADDMNSLQWLNAAKSVMPMNPVVDEEYKLKIMENGNMSAEKISEALKFEKQMTQQQQQQNAAGGGGKMAQTRPPVETINYKDVNASDPQAGNAMLQQAGLPGSQQGQQGQGQGGPQQPNGPQQAPGMQGPNPMSPQAPSQVVNGGQQKKGLPPVTMPPRTAARLQQQHAVN